MSDRAGVNPALRLFTTSLAVSTVGTGMWTSARVIFLVRCGLSPAEIASGLLIAGLLGAAATVPAGDVVDRYAARYGRRDVTAVLLALEGALAALFAMIHGFVGFLLVASAASAIERICAAAGATMIGEIFGENRVACRAAMQGAMNAGLCIGGLVGAAALASGSTAVLRAVAVANGLTYLAACVLTRRLPTPSAVGPVTGSAAHAPHDAAAARVPRRYASFGAANALLTVHAAILSVALPLWVTQSHLVPDWTVGASMFLNSAAVGLWQLPVTRRIQENAAAGSAALRSGVLLAASCCTLVAIQSAPGAARLPLLCVAVALYTWAELAHAASAIYLSYVLAAGHRLSSCQSYFASTIGVSKAVGPFAATAAVAAGPAGLLIFGVGLLIAGAGVRACADAWRPAL